MFSEKTHGKYSENSDDEIRGKRDSPAEIHRTRDHSSDDSHSDFDDDKNDADVSRDAPDDSLLGNHRDFIYIFAFLGTAALSVHKDCFS